ncbi:MAG: EAL domain-containing protein [Gammaproteobacteria bacterium]|nr:EAL domain-containing protein [Gammaproteobacteria bacterium]
MRLINTKQVLFFGFGSIFILMVLIGVIASDQMHMTFKSIEHIVKDNNIKTGLVSVMLVSARERTISLQKMTRMDDPFERDDEWMRFNSHGAKFMTARMQFIDLGTTPEEEAILTQQGMLTSRVVPVQIKIARMAVAGQFLEAEEMLRNLAIPDQDQVFVHLYKLLNLLEYESNQTLQDISEQIENTEQNLISAILIIILGCAAIAIAVFRRIRAAEIKLSREKERAQVTLHSIGDAVITTDEKGHIKYMNALAEELTESHLAKVVNKKISKIFAIVSDASETLLSNPVLDVLHNHTAHGSDGHAIMMLPSSVKYAIEYTASPIFDKENVLVGVVLVFRDVTDMRAMALQLGYQASHDELTGLINRREFESRVEMALMSARGENIQHAMCYIDLDQFKVVNDTCGHVAGDELLRQLSTLLKTVVRSGDTLARLGGDEFGVLYMSCSVEKAKQLAEKLRTVVNNFQFHWENKSFSVGVSMGLVPVDKHSNLHGLLSVADSACYVAKDEGRNRIHIFDDDDGIIAERKGQMQWVHKITSALESGRFEVYGQKMLAFDSALATHFEMLIRMLDEDGGVISPLAFIPAAERYNLMIWVDRWMIRHSFISIRHLINTGQKSSLLFSINVSAQSLCDDDFLPYVQDQLRETGLDPSLICFEITETSAIVNLTRAQHFMTTLKEMGCYFSLDDFGSGLSSFSYLKNLQVDFLKIDGTFIRDIIDDPIDRAMVEAINQVGHIMGIKTIAEYVESPETLELLRDMGVDFVQGFAVAAPVPVAEIVL